MLNAAGRSSSEPVTATTSSSSVDDSPSCMIRARRRAISAAARVSETMKPFRSAKLAMQAIER
jgi:hypothetical protein